MAKLEKFEDLKCWQKWFIHTVIKENSKMIGIQESN